MATRMSCFLYKYLTFIKLSIKIVQKMNYLKNEGSDNMNIDFARKLELAYHQQCKDLCNEFHLKQTGFDILMFLGNNPQYKYAKDIVEIRKIKANLVSIHVDQLVDQGYLSRIDVPGDRRKVELVLNKKANDVIKKRKKRFKTISFSSLFFRY